MSGRRRLIFFGATEGAGALVVIRLDSNKVTVDVQLKALTDLVICASGQVYHLLQMMFPSMSHHSVTPARERLVAKCSR